MGYDKSIIYLQAMFFREALDWSALILAEDFVIIRNNKNSLEWCPGQNKRIAPPSSIDVVKGDYRINNTYT
jgi:hypothetical protein